MRWRVACKASGTVFWNSATPAERRGWSTSPSCLSRGRAFGRLRSKARLNPGQSRQGLFSKIKSLISEKDGNESSTYSVLIVELFWAKSQWFLKAIVQMKTSNKHRYISSGQIACRVRRLIWSSEIHNSYETLWVLKSKSNTQNDKDKSARRSGSNAQGLGGVVV